MNPKTIIQRQATPEERLANEKALEEIKSLFPGLAEDTMSDFLMTCSPFPFCSIPDCLPGLRELARLSDGNLTAASSISGLQMELAHANGKLQEIHDFAAGPWNKIKGEESLPQGPGLYLVRHHDVDSYSLHQRVLCASKWTVYFTDWAEIRRPK